MPRISQLPALTTADNADELAIVDVSASTTKKITRGDLLKSPLPTNSVTTAAVADNAITANKLDFATVGVWEVLADQTLSSAGTAINVPLAADKRRKYYRIIAKGVSAAAGNEIGIRVNGQNANTSYDRTVSSAESGGVSAIVNQWNMLIGNTSVGVGVPCLIDVLMDEKSIATGLSFRPGQMRNAGAFCNAITSGVVESISLSSSANMQAGARITIFGRN